MHRCWKTSGDKNGGGGFYRTGTGRLFSEFFRLNEDQVNTPSKLIEKSETKVHLCIVGKVSNQYHSRRYWILLQYMESKNWKMCHMPTIWSCHFVEGQVLFCLRRRNFIKMCFASSEPVFDQHFKVNRSKSYWLLILFTHLIKVFLLFKLERTFLQNGAGTYRVTSLLKSKSIFVGEFHL